MNEAALKALLDELRAKHGVVGCTIGVLENDTIRCAGSGVLNLATGVECTADSVFQIGSIGKVFTTTLIMQLVDEGRLALDDTAISHVPELAIADTAALRKITIRQLLNHTSGIDGDFFPADDPEGPSTASYIRKMALLPSLYPPGEGPMTYCNSGFVVAGRIIELETGMTWQNAVMKRICRPLEMPAAFAHPHEALRFRSAMGHVADPADFRKAIIAPLTFLPQSAAAAGAVLSMSAESLLLFARAHLHDGTFGGVQLLTAQAARTMREDRIPIPPFTGGGLTHWGLGWLLSSSPGYEMAGHDGGTLGHLTYLRCFPEKGVAFTLLTNSPSAELFDDVEKHLMQALIGAPRHEDPPKEPVTFDAARYLGDYTNVAARYSVTTADGGLAFRSAPRIDGIAPIEALLEPWRRNTFAFRSDNPALARQKLVFLGSDNEPAQFLRVGSRMAKRL